MFKLWADKKDLDFAILLREDRIQKVLVDAIQDEMKALGVEFGKIDPIILGKSPLAKTVKQMVRDRVPESSRREIKRRLLSV